MMKTFARPRLLVLALYIASAALVTVQQAILRHSNNVSIFRSASFNLFAGRDLYAAHPEQQDRKSTRLNPSHRCISYAVFCLKKKKNYKKVYMLKKYAAIRGVAEGGAQ